jgi:hypothetical protein
MTKKNRDFQNVYQFKISLDDIKPLIWRRILVPENFSFWDLHVAIQDAMGWFDCHLHQFSTIERRFVDARHIGIPDDENPVEILPGWKEKIADWFHLEKRTRMNYEYDFGDGWRHKVELEKIMPAENSKRYPICLAGKRACPPEDCGSIPGYYHILKVLKDGPKDEDDKELMDWLGGDFDSEYFDCAEVYFENPAKRLEEFKRFR